jgi:hypothetical protein
MANPNRSLTKVQNALINDWEPRDLKHFKISLALWDALTKISLSYGEKDSKSS